MTTRKVNHRVTLKLKSEVHHLDNDGDFWSTCVKLAEVQQTANMKAGR